MVKGAAGTESRWATKSFVAEGSIAAGSFGRMRAVEAVFEAG